MRLRRRRALKPLFARAISFHSWRALGPSRYRRFTSLAQKGDVSNTLVLVRQQALDLGLLGLVHELGTAQAPLPLGRFVRQEVALVRLLVLHVALGGDLEALLRARVGLHLRHGLIFLVITVTW